ncbi:hypothetical protein QCC34_09170 [Pseudomonas aeruginosa]|nr:hypothetical protein [Pseudomonas aeruginosa]HCL2760559.1 hypothetical protein [Pseudomonas aeruginosa 449A]ELH2217023.1 hypothetical protein [Pseudomonas aeruginosa]EMC2778922.1 hypothetical protein [Pseudomonas aeruginosa]KJJ15209.1 hypothetical protein HMPREF3150_04203 [Pseudomonas aeruginosa]MBI7266859.1 hypothetical protein [Pseudomonas aeruginosa]
MLSTSLSIDAELAPVHAECRRALRAWHASIERALRADGLAEKLAASRAWLILAALEGAVAVARVERSFQALDAIEEELQALLPA